MAESTVSMKLLIDRSNGNRVLFAEASKECVDVLFHILSLPVATVIRLLQDEEMEGSLPTLYKSLQTLDDTYIQPNEKKDTYLKPVAPLSCSSAPLLTLEDASTDTYLKPVAPVSRGASSVKSSCSSSGSVRKRKKNCCGCGQKMKSTVVIESDHHSPAVEAPPGHGGLVNGMVTYMVTDDFHPCLLSLCSISFKFKVKDVASLEEKVVNFGMKEVLYFVVGFLCFWNRSIIPFLWLVFSALIESLSSKDATSA